MPIAYYDGRFMEKADIKISPTDFGFSRGMSVFEFTRIYGRVPFHLDDHLKRFRDGAAYMGMPLAATDAEMTKAVQHMTDNNGYAHSGVKFYLTLGECGKSAGFGFKNSTDFTPHLIMLHEELKPDAPEAPYGAALYKRGAALKTLSPSRQISDVKTINYAPGFRASLQLRGTDFDEILYRHDEGYVTETTTSNFYCVIDGVLHTPGKTVLHGITRIVVKKLAEKLGLNLVESDITMDDLRRASEAFIASSFAELMPISRIDDITYAVTNNAPVYSQLRKAFTAYIADYCGERKA